VLQFEDEDNQTCVTVSKIGEVVTLSSNEGQNLCITGAPEFVIDRTTETTQNSRLLNTRSQGWNKSSFVHVMRCLSLK
jgi:hypothetical protein